MGSLRLFPLPLGVIVEVLGAAVIAVVEDNGAVTVVLIVDVCLLLLRTRQTPRLNH